MRIPNRRRVLQNHIVTKGRKSTHHRGRFFHGGVVGGDESGAHKSAGVEDETKRTSILILLLAKKKRGKITSITSKATEIMQLKTRTIHKHLNIM